MKEIRVRVWNNLDETIMQCLEIPKVKTNKPNEGQAKADIIQQLNDLKEKRGTPFKLIFIKSEEVEI